MEYEAFNTNTNTKSSDFNLKKFESQITFNDDKYEVPLPWKMFRKPLPGNFKNCKQRLTEKLKEYDDIISSHIAEDIVEVAENISVPGKCHCLPHHPAYKESSASAETRIVYDVSSKRKGPSLNDCL